MPKHAAARQARHNLDDRLAGLGRPDQFLTPPRGWVRAIREALGMSASDLAARMKVTRQVVHALELSEAAGGARIDTLRRAAAAMDCTLVYAFPPNHTLQSVVETEAAKLLDGRVQPKATGATGAPYDQSNEPAPTARRTAIEELVESGKLWRAGGQAD